MNDVKTPWKGGRRRNETEYQEKREALLAAAASLFRHKGYESASLGELADILNITKPTLYYYVDSKDHLLLLIKLRVQDEALALLREIEGGPGTAADRLYRIMLRYAMIMTSDAGACMSLIPSKALEPQSRVEVQARVDEANSILLRLLAAGKKDKTLNISDPTVTLHALFGSLNWTSHWYREDGRLSPEKLAKLQVDLLMSGVSTVPLGDLPKVTPKQLARRG